MSILMKKCEGCNGDGFRRPHISFWSALLSIGTIYLLDLQEECVICDGTGYVPDFTQETLEVNNTNKTFI